MYLEGGRDILGLGGGVPCGVYLDLFTNFAFTRLRLFFSSIISKSDCRKHVTVEATPGIIPCFCEEISLRVLCTKVLVIERGCNLFFFPLSLFLSFRRR